MKNIIISALTVIVLTIVTLSNSFAAGDPTSFMVKCNLPLAQSYAKQEHKPLMIYVHSNKCISCRTFARQIFAKGEFAKWADKNFICMEANVTTKEGKEIAKKYGVMKVPAIIMVSSDQDLDYAVEMKLDSASLYSQFRSFITANNLKSQIDLLQTTNGLSYEDASKAVAASYAKRDYKKNPAASAETMAAERTLNIEKLNALNKAYIAEFKKLATGTPSRK